MSLIEQLRAEAREAPESGIVEVFTHGRGRQGLIPLWAGEGDLPTPDFICRAGGAVAGGGRDLLHCQRGIPELREALARYHSRHFGHAFAAERFIVTGGGMQAIQLALQATAGAGDEVLYLEPGLAEPAGRGGHRWRHSGGRRARPVRQWLDARRRPAGCGGDAADAGDLRQLAVQPDRLDRRPRDPGGDPGAGAAARAVDHRRRDLQPVPLRRRPRALLHGRHGGRRPHPVRQYLLQELGDDRLADRLADAASLAAAGVREPGAVLDLRRCVLHAARRGGGARRGRRLPLGARSSGPASPGTAWRDGWSPPGRCGSACRRAPSTCSLPSTGSPTAARSRSR